MKDVINKSLENAMNYKAYKNLIRNLLESKKSTGNKQSEELYNFSLLNDRRMHRLDKTLRLSGNSINGLKKIKESQTWLVITEGWCGDAAQNIPVLNKFAEECENIDLKFVLRDQNEELMNLFLTNGSKSIPKLIALDTLNNVIGTWGPRPSGATKMVEDYKERNGILDATFKKDLQIWYNKTKGKNTEEDLLSMLS